MLTNARHRAVLKIFLLLHGDSFVPPSLSPSFSSPLLLHTGWISTLGPPPPLPSVALQWHHHRFALVNQPIHHRQRAVSPNDRARRGRVGGNLNLKQPEWVKWKNHWLGKKTKKTVWLIWDLRGNRDSKSSRVHGDSLKCCPGFWFWFWHLKYICSHYRLCKDQHVMMKYKVKE